MHGSPSIVPAGGDQEVYLVLDDFGSGLGRAWRETRTLLHIGATRHLKGPEEISGTSYSIEFFMRGPVLLRLRVARHGTRLPTSPAPRRGRALRSTEMGAILQDLVVREERAFQAWLHSADKRSIARKRRKNSLSHLMRRRKL